MFNIFQLKLKIRILENRKSDVPNIRGLKSYPTNENKKISKYDPFLLGLLSRVFKFTKASRSHN